MGDYAVASTITHLKFADVHQAFLGHLVLVFAQQRTFRRRFLLWRSDSIGRDRGHCPPFGAHQDESKLRQTTVGGRCKCLKFNQSTETHPPTKQ